MFILGIGPSCSHLGLSQQRSETDIYILFKKALAVERPSLLAVPMKNVASSSFTQSELVELCQWAGGSWGTHPLLCGVQVQV